MHPYLRFELRPRAAEEDRGEAPPLPAALVRRVLGKALIDSFCPFGEPRCQAVPAGEGARPSPQDLCLLAACCPYGVLFAASSSPRPPFALHTARGEGGSEGFLELTLFG